MTTMECSGIGINVSDLDRYVEEHAGIHATKAVSEQLQMCPPENEALAMQRLMAQEHVHLYGGFAQHSLRPLSVEEIQDILLAYEARKERVPAMYGAVPGAASAEYFVVGQNRTYESIRREIEQRFGEQSIGGQLAAVIDRYVTVCQVESWVAARFVIRLLQKTLPELVKQIQLARGEFTLVPTAAEMISYFVASPFIEENIAWIREGQQKKKKPENSFNEYLRGLDIVPADQPLLLTIEPDEIESFALVNHVMERPYTAQELEMAQSLLDSNPAFRTACIVFQSKLIQYFEAYLLHHPERLQHTFEHFSEIFIPVEENQEVLLAPNPKLLKILSKNVVPAIAREYLASGDAELLPQHIAAGAQTAKDLRLFQTIIGEFRTSEHAITFDGLMAQMCPAMQPFSAALKEVLPEIYRQVCELQVR